MRKYIRYNKKSRISKIGRTGISWVNAPDIKSKINKLLNNLEEASFLGTRIFAFRSTSAKTRAMARIWGLGRIWQIALKQKPAYIIEVISEKFDKLDDNQKDKVLLHELAHIPKNFSGSLVPHIRHGKRSFNEKLKRFISKSLK